MITIQLSPEEARYIRFCITSDRETLNNGDFEEPPHREQDRIAGELLKKLEAAEWEVTCRK